MRKLESKWKSCRARTALRLDQAQEIAGIKDLDPNIASDRAQSFIAGDDRVGLEGDRAFNELVVGGVRLDDRLPKVDDAARMSS